MKKSFSSQTLIPSQNAAVHVTREQPKKILRIDTWTSSDSCLKPAEFPHTSKSKLFTANSFKTKGSILTPLTTLKSATPKETLSVSKLLQKTKIPHIQNFTIHPDEKANASRFQESLLASAELSKQLTENNSNWFSEKKFFQQSSLNKSESPKKLYTPSHIQTISQKPKEKEGKKANLEFRELQQRISKLLDKTQEKLKLEEIRDLSPQRQEIQHVFDEIEDLRKLTHSQNVIKKRKELPPAFEKLARQQNQTLYEMNRGQSNFNNSISTSQLESKTPMLDMSPNVRRDKQFDDPPLNETNTTFSRIRTQDPFDKMILYQDHKMPFSLALMAKMRHKMFNEVKQQNPIQIQEVDKTSVITVLREKLVPEEKAKFLEKLDEVEKLKKYNEMKSKKANTSAIYQLIALNKTSQKRLKSKMKEQFPVNSRFLKL